MSKVCSGCKIDLPLEKFHKNKSSKDGLQWHCIDCRKVFTKKDRQVNKLKRYKKQKEWRDNNKDKVKNIKLKAKYGISYEDYAKAYEKQNGTCSICLEAFDILCVDHCHSSGEIRGLLCTNCNLGLGNFLDNKESLMRAIEYLKEFETGVRECS